MFRFASTILTQFLTPIINQWDSIWLQNSRLHQTSEHLGLPITAMGGKKEREPE